MKPEADERSEHEAIERVYREASDAQAERPDPQVRAAVLAAAARAVDAKPHDAARSVASHPFAAQRWPLSAAALLVVSIMTGLVATRGWWERPDLVDANQDRRETMQAPAQTAAPSSSDTQSAGAIAPADAEVDKGQSARREPESRPASPRRRAPSVAAPKVNDSVTRDAPAEAAPDLAGEISSGPMRQKAEAPSSNAAPAPAAPAAPATSAAAITQGPLSRSADAQAGAREKTDASSRAESRIEPESPEAWTDRIVKLRAAGNDDEADREVARLKRRYPNFTIPREALRAMGTR